MSNEQTTTDMTNANHNTQCFDVEIENQENDTVDGYHILAVSLRAAIEKTERPTDSDVVIRIYGQKYTAAMNDKNTIITDNITGKGWVENEVTEKA